MASPTANDLLGLGYSFDGSPFVQISKAGATEGLNFSFDGSPFWAVQVEDLFNSIIFWM